MPAGGPGLSEEIFGRVSIRGRAERRLDEAAVQKARRRPRTRRMTMSQTNTTSTTTTTGRKTLWAGRIISGLVVALLALDSSMKLVMAAPVIEGTQKLGYPVSSIVPIGLILAVCVAVYVIPRTAIIGAVLLTGYLGGAVATHLRVGDPLFSHTVFPLYVAVLIWGGLLLRDRRVRALLAPRAHA
jgi:hypothetical protein